MTDLASSIFHSVTHLKQSPAGCKSALPPLRSRLTPKFQGYNIDATYSDYFRCKNTAAPETILPPSQLPTQDTLQLLVLKVGEQRADVCWSCA